MKEFFPPFPPRLFICFSSLLNFLCAIYDGFERFFLLPFFTESPFLSFWPLFSVFPIFPLFLKCLFFRLFHLFRFASLTLFFLTFTFHYLIFFQGKRLSPMWSTSSDLDPVLQVLIVYLTFFPFFFVCTDAESFREHKVRGGESNEKDEGESAWAQEHQPAHDGGIPLCAGEAYVPTHNTETHSLYSCRLGQFFLRDDSSSYHNWSS